MPVVFFITHPDAATDPSIPVPDWPLNARGQSRMQAMAAFPWTSGVRYIFSSNERKARDAAQQIRYSRKHNMIGHFLLSNHKKTHNIT
jgi:hypothetical protein